MATPLRNVRVPDDVWTAAQRAATARGTTVSAVIVVALERYGRRHGGTAAPRVPTCRTCGITSQEAPADSLATFVEWHREAGHDVVEL